MGGFRRFPGGLASLGWNHGVVDPSGKHPLREPGPEAAARAGWRGLEAGKGRAGWAEEFGWGRETGGVGWSDVGVGVVVRAVTGCVVSGFGSVVCGVWRGMAGGE